MTALSHRDLSDDERRAPVRTSAIPGGGLPYADPQFGYLWHDMGDGTAEAESRDGRYTMQLDFELPGGQVAWFVEDDYGLVAEGNFSGLSPEQVIWRANREMCNFDTNPVIPPKPTGYDKNYREEFPVDPIYPSFREPALAW